MNIVPEVFREFAAEHKLAVADGADSDVDFEFLVAITRVPPSEPLVPTLFCRPPRRIG